MLLISFNVLPFACCSCFRLVFVVVARECFWAPKSTVTNTHTLAHTEQMLLALETVIFPSLFVLLALAHSLLLLLLLLVSISLLRAVWWDVYCGWRRFG